MSIIVGCRDMYTLESAQVFLIKLGIKPLLHLLEISTFSRVSVQGVKSLGGHFACFCRGFEFYEVKKKMEILLHFQSFLC